jgi:type II secretory pathway pseudopilin PulG
MLVFMRRDRQIRRMHMKRLETNTLHRGHRASGFSLLEVMIVLAIGIVASVVSVISLVPMLNNQHVVNAYNTTLSVMRQARDNAVSQRTSYSVVFSTAVTPNTITMAPTTAFTNDQPADTYQLPSGVTFLVQTGYPSTGPDGYGTGANAIDFGYTSGGSTGIETIYFCPDGSAQTSSACSGAGNWDGGVVYLARSGDLLSSRAVTLWGATGRIHGWRLYGQSGAYQWIRQ